MLLFLKLDYSFYIIEEDARFLFLSLLHIFVFLDVFLVSRIIQYYHSRARNHGMHQFFLFLFALFIFFLSFSSSILPSSSSIVLCCAGHLEFNRSTKGIRKAPLMTSTFGLAAHLALFCLWEGNEDHIGFDRLNLLQVVFSVEFLVCVSVFLVLMIKTIQFNRLRPSPDSIEALLPQYDTGRAGSIHSAPETGFKYKPSSNFTVKRSLADGCLFLSVRRSRSTMWS